MLQEKQTGNESHMINQEIVAVIDKLLEYRCSTPTPHKKTTQKFNLNKKYDYIRWINISLI